jgi:Ca2+-binding RTX toxin-like protein
LKTAINGGASIDTLVGGTGNDIYIVDTTTDIIREDSGGGTDTVRASVSYSLGEYLNNLTLTGTRAINGTGNDYNNIITGNNANNVLDGRGGIDTLIGGRGNDTYIVNSTTDTIIEYEGGGSGDTVQSSVSYTLGAWLNNLTLTGTNAINGTGNNFDNTIIGNDGNNILKGGAGNDTLKASSYYDKDSLFGEAGDDNLTGGTIHFRREMRSI